MRRRWWKRITPNVVYRSLRYAFHCLTGYGFYMAILHGNISDNLVQAPEPVTKAVFIVGVLCMLMGEFGALRYKRLEKEENKEQREEDRRVLRRSA